MSVLRLFAVAAAASFASGCVVSPSLWPLLLGLEYRSSFSVEAEVVPSTITALEAVDTAVQVGFDIRGNSPPVVLLCRTSEGILGTSLVAEMSDDEISGDVQDRVVETGPWHLVAAEEVLSGRLTGLGVRASCDSNRRGNAYLSTVTNDVCGRTDLHELAPTQQQDLFHAETRLALSEGFDLKAACYNAETDEPQEPDHVVVRIDDED